MSATQDGRYSILSKVSSRVWKSTLDGVTSKWNSQLAYWWKRNTRGCVITFWVVIIFVKLKKEVDRCMAITKLRYNEIKIVWDIVNSMNHSHPKDEEEDISWLWGSRVESSEPTSIWRHIPRADWERVFQVGRSRATTNKNTTVKS